MVGQRSQGDSDPFLHTSVATFSFATEARKKKTLKHFSVNLCVLSVLSVTLKKTFQIGLYSTLKESTGLINAALIDWELTVSKAMADAITPATRNTIQVMDML